MPNRLIKESIKNSPEIDQLSWFEEVVFYRLIVTADDFGRLDGRTIVLLHELFPTKDNITRGELEDAFDKLIAVGLLVPYTDEETGRNYYFLPTWKEHQRVRNSKSKYPDPPAEINLAATRGKLRRIAADCGGLPQTAENCGELRLARAESNPIQSNPIQSESESNARAHAHEDGDNDDDGQENPFGDCDETRPDFDTVEVYASNNLAPLSPGNMQEFEDFKADVPDELIRFAIDEACSRGARTWAYVRSILNSYCDNGIKTVGEAKAAKEKRLRKEIGDSPPPRDGKGPFGKFY